MIRHAIWPAAIAVVLIAASSAFAQDGNENRVGGRVTAVDAKANTITVQGFRSPDPMTFKVNTDTKYQISVPAKASDLKVGDTIMVGGQPSDDDDNLVVARFISIQPAGASSGQGGGGRRFGIQGTVASLTPALTITTDDGTKTVQTSADTQYTTSKSGGLGDVAVGKGVFAMLGDNQVATQVMVRPPFSGRRGGGQWGGQGHHGNHGGAGAGGHNPSAAGGAAAAKDQ